MYIYNYAKTNTYTNREAFEILDIKLRGLNIRRLVKIL
jgi:hypothetical protein